MRLFAVICLLALVSSTYACDGTSSSQTWTTLVATGPNSIDGPTGLDTSQPLQAGTYYIYGRGTGTTNCVCAACSSCCSNSDFNSFEVSAPGGLLTGVATHSGAVFDDTIALKDHSGVFVTFTTDGDYLIATNAVGSGVAFPAIGSFGTTLSVTIATLAIFDLPRPTTEWHMYTPSCVRFQYTGADSSATIRLVPSSGPMVDLEAGVSLSPGGLFVELDVFPNRAMIGDVHIRIVTDSNIEINSPTFTLVTEPAGNWPSNACDSAASTPLPSQTQTPSVTAMPTVSPTPTRTPSMTVTPSVTPTNLSALCPNPNEVFFMGRCYYLDGTNGCVISGYTLAPQSVLNSIANNFVGLDYRTQVSTNCCIHHADEGAEGQDWGFPFPGQCNSPGPFTEAPALGGANCINANNGEAAQLTICVSV